MKLRRFCCPPRLNQKSAKGFFGRSTLSIRAAIGFAPSSQPVDAAVKRSQLAELIFNYECGRSPSRISMRVQKTPTLVNADKAGQKTTQPEKNKQEL